jgi:hypothetical protein
MKQNTKLYKSLNLMKIIFRKMEINHVLKILNLRRIDYKKKVKVKSHLEEIYKAPRSRNNNSQKNRKNPRYGTRYHLTPTMKNLLLSNNSFLRKVKNKDWKH